MKKFLILLSILFVITLLQSEAAHAGQYHTIPGTVVNGEIIINGEVVLDKTDKPYIISGGVKVEMGGTLKIKDGAKILFANQGSNISVEGKLIAEGNQNNIMLFKEGDNRFSPPNHYIQIKSTGFAKLEHVEISGANRGIYLDNGTAIVRNSRFSNNQSGIYVSSGLLDLRNCVFEGNGTGLIGDCLTGNIINNTFKSNANNGIFLTNSSQNTNIIFNTFENNNINNGTNVAGIKIKGSDGFYISHNNFINNHRNDIYFELSIPGFNLNDNYWGGSGPSKIGGIAGYTCDTWLSQPADLDNSNYIFIESDNLIYYEMGEFDIIVNVSGSEIYGFSTNIIKPEGIEFIDVLENPALVDGVTISNINGNIFYMETLVGDSMGRSLNSQVLKIRGICSNQGFITISQETEMTDGIDGDDGFPGLIPHGKNSLTLKILPSPSIRGKVNLQRPGLYQDITITVSKEGTYHVINSNSYGEFSLQVVPGVYNITLSAPFYLSKTVTATVNQTETIIPTETLLFGDINGDGKIDLEDLKFIAVHYGKTSDSHDWEDIKGLDVLGNNRIGLRDIVTAAKNWTKDTGVEE